MVDASLHEEMAAQLERVRRRSRAVPGADPDDLPRAAAAARHVHQLRRDLGLTRFRGLLVPASLRPHFLLVFDHELHGEVVLKAYGRSRPGEVHLQQLWANRGVPTAELLAAGNDPHTWMLMRRLPQSSPHPDLCPYDASDFLTDEVAALMMTAHEAVADAADEAWCGYRRSGPTVLQHLRSAEAALAANGYRCPDVGAVLLRAHSGSAQPLHGDLASSNVVRDGRSGKLNLIDASAYLGPREFDAARWAARRGGAAYGERLLGRWLDVEPGLDADVALLLLGLELLMEAGVRETIKAESGVGAGADRGTLGLLTRGEALIDEYSR